MSSRRLAVVLACAVLCSLVIAGGLVIGLSRAGDAAKPPNTVTQYNKKDCRDPLDCLNLR